MRGIFLKSDKIATQDLSVAPLSIQTAFKHRFKLDQITVHFSQAVSETITITHISKNGVNFNTVLQSVVLVSETDFVYRPQGDAYFQTNDEILVQCTNANGVGIVYTQIKTSELGGGG